MDVELVLVSLEVICVVALVLVVVGVKVGGVVE